MGGCYVADLGVARASRSVGPAGWSRGEMKVRAEMNWKTLAAEHLEVFH